MAEKGYEKYREFLKDSFRQVVDFMNTEQSRGVPAPPVEKPFDDSARRVMLEKPEKLRMLGKKTLYEAIEHRVSRRRFREEPLTLEELSFLLWATQGVRKDLSSRGTAFRTVPSAGCRHALETYLIVFNVKGLDEGIYRYLPLKHELIHVSSHDNLGPFLVNASLGQEFTARSAVTFAWTTIPRRMEWRYAEASHKVIAIDAGHVCQNLYLACESIGCGTCAVGAYSQEGMDELLGVDGKEEFTIYMAPVGKV